MADLSPGAQFVSDVLAAISKARAAGLPDDRIFSILDDATQDAGDAVGTGGVWLGVNLDETMQSEKQEMNTSLRGKFVSKPVRGEAISSRTLQYVRARNRNKAHSMLLEVFANSGLKKSDLAAMLDEQPAQITHWLANSGNITLDALSDLIFALNGRFLGLCQHDGFSKGVPPSLPSGSEGRGSE